MIVFEMACDHDGCYASISVPALGFESARNISAADGWVSARHPVTPAAPQLDFDYCPDHASDADG